MNNTFQQTALRLALGTTAKVDLLRSQHGMVRRISTDSQNAEDRNEFRKSLNNPVDEADETAGINNTQRKAADNATADVPDFTLLNNKLEEVQRGMDNGEQQIRGVWQLWNNDHADGFAPYGASCTLLAGGDNDPQLLQVNPAVPIVQEPQLFNFNQLAAALDDMAVEPMI